MPRARDASLVARLCLVALPSCCGDSCCGDSLPAPGVVAPDAPTQEGLEKPLSWTRDGYQFEALATFRVTARVLWRERYYTDRSSDLAPVDLALGWGPMSDSSVYGKLQIDQSGRWYYYRWGQEGPPIPKKDIIRSSANMHLIPESDDIEDKVKGAKRHELVVIEGYLVHVRGADGWRWRSSLSRTDAGSRSCEVVWVSSFDVH